jgi:hypothetical protein
MFFSFEEELRTNRKAKSKSLTVEIMAMFVTEIYFYFGGYSIFSASQI